MLNTLNAQQRVEEIPLKIGVMQRWALNAITDVEGVKVGHDEEFTPPAGKRKKTTHKATATT